MAMAVTRDKSERSPERLLTVREASEILSVHPNTVRVWSDDGLLPAYRIGPRRDRRFKLEDVESLLRG
ncbi:MAG: helix-turn-helix domain-containing protein [Chloroflexota bacterium]|nr:helix-turn-helix domain-containing protein [Chloroflexota bacterium]